MRIRRRRFGVGNRRRKRISIKSVRRSRRRRSIDEKTRKKQVE